MADEMKKNLENEEIELAALENVSGGLVVDTGPLGYARVVDDTTGAELGSKCYLKDAKKLAQKLNVSDEIISKEEYKRRFGKDI